MTYSGGKNNSYQKLINLIPPHEVFVSPFLGSGAIMRHKLPALHNIGNDLDPEALELFSSLATEETLSSTKLFQLSAVEIIQRYGIESSRPTFIYLDPPYPYDVRSSDRPLYNVEMGHWDQHKELLELVLECDCMIMISSYWSEMYSSMLDGWETFTYQSRTRGGGTATEWVWMNYSQPERLHDYRYLGDTFTQRQQIKRKKNRHVQKFLKMDPLERSALLWGLEEAGIIPPVVTELSNSSAGKKQLAVTEPAANFINEKHTDCYTKSVSAPDTKTPAQKQPFHGADFPAPDANTKTEVCLSLFPGVDILGRGFEGAGFSVVRGPDPLWGGDIRDFSVPAGRFDGVFGGPPCQGFSDLNRSLRADGSHESTIYSLEMLDEFKRIVQQARPTWWLMENVRNVPDLIIEGYTWQRIDVRASEFGLNNRRLRHFQFGTLTGEQIVLPREDNGQRGPIAACKSGAPWSKYLERQGLPLDFDLPGMGRTAKKKAIGNAVAYPVALAIANAIRNRVPAGTFDLCECDCARPLTGDKTYAKTACRVKMHRRRNKVQLA